MRFRSAIIATAFLATPVVAMAQPITGLYVGAGAGLQIPQNPERDRADAEAGVWERLAEAE